MKFWEELRNLLKAANLPAVPSELRAEEWGKVVQSLFELRAAQVKRERKRVCDMSDEEWITSLEGNEAYKGLNVRHEIARCAAWYHANVSKTGAPTRQRITNWLLKADKVVQLKAAGAQYATGLKPPPPPAPEGWLTWLKTELSLISDDHPAHGQLLTAYNCRNFTTLPQSWQQRCRENLSA